MATIRVNVIKPGEVVSFEIWGEEGPLAHIVLEAPEITDLIRSLSDLRASMSDAVPLAIDPGTKVTGILDPKWQMPPRQPDGHRALSLRHPGLGWLSFAFPVSEAEAIAAQLVNNSAPTAPLQPRLRPNPFLKTFTIEITKHAAVTLRERRIERDWLHRTLFSPDFTEKDPTDAELLRLYKAIPERDGRVLRVAAKPLPDGFKIITAFFDRSRK